MLDTSNPNNYYYTTKHLEIHILGGIKLNKLESLRVTLSIQKLNHHIVLRHSKDLYNDNQVEKFTRTIAERLEIGTSVTRQTLQELTKELENHRFLLLKKEDELYKPYFKELTGSERQSATDFLKKKNLLQLTNDLIGKSGVIGEQTNRLLMYLIFTSRLTNNPLHCISLGSSGVLEQLVFLEEDYRKKNLYIRLMSIRCNASNNKPVEDLFTEIPAVKLVNELIQV